MQKKIQAGLLFFLFLSGWGNGRAQSDLAPTMEQLQSRHEEAIRKVKAIINQPVTKLNAYEGASCSSYHPGWFHDGAEKPDFDTVDVRRTRETPYARSAFVTSDLNPGFMFRGSECEFNPMTKYFYVDRTLPKKKLTEAEMIEVNRLYRVIGQTEKEMSVWRNPFTASASGGPNLWVVGGFVLVALFAFMFHFRS
jgi:hypothetical protein